MDVQDLEVLIALADELHFGRAARRLQMTQPPLTKRVQKLERSLGVRLFERNRHGVRPTEEGAELLELARRALREVRRVELHARGLRNGESGTITVAAVGSAFYAALPALLEPCRRRHPQIRLLVRELESAALVDALRDGDVDLGFVRPPVGPELDSWEVWREPLVVAVASTSPLARSDRVGVEHLVGHSLVFFDRAIGPGYWDRVAELFASQDVPLEPAVTTDHVTTMLGLVALGEGISIVPSSAQNFQHVNVRFVGLDPPALLPLAVAVPRPPVRPTVRTFLATLPRRPLRYEHPAGIPVPPSEDIAP
ncbi:transcriptional regulator, LysR family [Geodermatophilus saharensis]|uniref:Transcriptional regulator, LysR family n=1 Tax=Geodermatophilus saharensis TaxID=1137994 RepID=A0A239HSA6_9ACTN|nr:LysR family transcriptional regulator [Geodermatophilus saharensis]SNS83958.1 transcriptional regulator, LysR family [Geodermatophilus saharensis]